MMHLAYPNVRGTQFLGCVRYVSLSPALAPGTPYAPPPLSPPTPNLELVRTAVQDLIAEWSALQDRNDAADVYQIADAGAGIGAGTSLDLAYLLSLIRCVRPLELEALGGAGDVWCTGALGYVVGEPVLQAVSQPQFDTKLTAFCQQAHRQHTPDRLFFVPSANVAAHQSKLCDQHHVRILSLAGFREALVEARVAGCWTDPAVIRVGNRELKRLVATIFQPPVYDHRLPRKPYMFLDPFGPGDTELFYGRDHDIEQLQRELAASRLLILFGASGTGKTSLIQAGLLPSLPAERYAWVAGRLIDEDPAHAIKAALVRELGVDRTYLERPLVDGVTAATNALRKEVVLVLDQCEELFQRHTHVVRRQFARELGECLDAVRLEVHVLIAVREDHYARLDEFRDAIPQIFHNTMRLTRLTTEQAFAAVVEPAKRLGLTIDTAMVQTQLLPELSAAGQESFADPGVRLPSPLDEPETGIEPPLLQIVCDALYQQAAREHRTTIGGEEYTAVGDLRTVLGRYLDTTLRQFGTEHRNARGVLKALVTAGHTNWAGFPEELALRMATAGLPLTAQVIEQRFLHPFLQARLARATSVEGQTRYELAHEYLAAHIAEWLAEDERAPLARLELIAQAAAAYKRTGLLLEPVALQWIFPYRAQLVLTPEQRVFLERSEQEAERRQQDASLEERRRVRRWVGGAVLIVVLGLGSIFGWRLYGQNRALQQANRKAREEERRASNQLVAFYVEQGRQELSQGRTLEALPYLSAAYAQGEPNSVLRFLLAQAMQPVDALVSTLGGDHGPMHSAVFSPDGTLVVTASDDGAVEIWETVTGQRLSNIDGGPLGLGQTKEVHAVAFSPDGTLVVVAGWKDGVTLWKLRTRNPLEPWLPDVLGLHGGPVNSVAFSPDGKQIVTASDDGTAKTWDVPTREWDLSSKLRFTLQGHKGAVVAAAFSPNGKLIVTASKDNTAKIWDASTGGCLHTLADHDEAVVAAAFSPDGTRVVTASGDGKAKIWETVTGNLKRTLPHRAAVLAAAFSPDGTRVVTASQDGTAKIWDPETKTGEPQATLDDHKDPVVAAAFSPDGTRVVTASRDKTAKIWETVTGDLRFTLEGHSGAVVAVAFSRDGAQVVTASEDGTAKVWKSTKSRLLTLLDGQTWPVRAVGFSPDGAQVVTGMTNGEVKICEASSGKVLHILKGGHKEPVSSVAFGPNGKWVVTASLYEETARIWDSATGARKFPLPHKYPVLAATFSPDGRVVTADTDGTIKTWDSATGRFLFDWAERTPEVKAVTFSPSGKWAVTIDNYGAAKVLETARGTLLHTWRHIHDVGAGRYTDPAGSGTLLQTWRHVHDDAVVSAAFSQDSKWVVTTYTDNTATIWEVATGKIQSVLRPEQQELHSRVTAAFSPDGTRVVTGGKTIQIWESATGRLLTTLSGNTDTYSAAFSPDGTQLVAASWDGGAKLWSMPLETRSPDDIVVLVRCRAPWRLDNARLMPAAPLVDEFGDRPDRAGCESQLVAR